MLDVEVTKDEMHYREACEHIGEPHVFQTVEWGRVKAVCGWTPSFLIVTEQHPVAAGLYLERYRWPVRVIYVPGGPVVRSVEAVGEAKYAAAISAFCTGLKALAKGSLAFIKISIDMDISDARAPLLSSSLRESGFIPSRFPIGHANTALVDLTLSEDVLLSNMEARTRYEIRKAQREGLTVMCGGEELVDAFYKLYLGTSERSGFGARSRAEISAIINTGIGKVFLAFCGSQATSGALIVRSGRSMWYLYGGSVRGVKVTGAELLQWKIMQWGKQHGIDRYDLQGFPSNVEQGHPLFGVYLFKRGFGGRVVRCLGEFDYWRPSIVGGAGYVALRGLLRRRQR